MAVQQPMQGIFPGLFPSVAQSQPNLMQAFPFMMSQPQPQQHSYRQAPSAFAPNIIPQQTPMNRPHPVSSAPHPMQQASPQPQFNQQANPLGMLNLGGNLNAHVNQVGQYNPHMRNQNAYRR